MQDRYMQVATLTRAIAMSARYGANPFRLAAIANANEFRPEQKEPTDVEQRN